MLLDLSKLRGGEEHVERRFEPQGFELPPEDLRLTAPVEFAGVLRKDGQKVRLIGRLKTTFECDCSRCLEAYTVPVDVALDLMFLPVPESAEGQENEVAADDLGVSYYKDEEIDLTELIREQLYLVLPMKPLCREDCRGICPECGKNRNRETCDCRAEWVDPRMEALRALRNK